MQLRFCTLNHAKGTVQGLPDANQPMELHLPARKILEKPLAYESGIYSQKINFDVQNNSSRIQCKPILNINKI
jgi:hypothetical protein